MKNFPLYTIPFLSMLSFAGPTAGGGGSGSLGLTGTPPAIHGDTPYLQGTTRDFIVVATEKGPVLMSIATPGKNISHACVRVPTDASNSFYGNVRWKCETPKYKAIVVETKAKGLELFVIEEGKEILTRPVTFSEKGGAMTFTDKSDAKFELTVDSVLVDKKAKFEAVLTGNADFLSGGSKSFATDQVEADPKGKVWEYIGLISK